MNNQNGYKVEKNLIANQIPHENMIKQNGMKNKSKQKKGGKIRLKKS